MTEADRQFEFSGTGFALADTTNIMRSEIDAALAARFGIRNLDTSGKKATRVTALAGSRAPVDVVSTVRYGWVRPDAAGTLILQEGVAIRDKSGTWTQNFPVQHHENGKAKRERTSHRFKKVVRSLKRLRDKLVATQMLGQKQCPSFLIECLAYAVEDHYYLLTSSNERYDRVVHIVERMDALLSDPTWVQNVTEINGIKYLFHPSQTWSADGASAFVRAAHARLMVE
jgi:hypothetical protein